MRKIKYQKFGPKMPNLDQARLFLDKLNFITFEELLAANFLQKTKKIVL